MHKLWASISWKLISCGCFAGINALVRYLSGGSGLTQEAPLATHSIMFWQNTLGAMVLLPWLWSRHGRAQILHTQQPLLNVLRILIAVLGIGMWYLSLRYFPVTQVVALSFLAPVITIFGAVIFLKETLTWPRASALGLSLLGGFLISRPDQNCDGLLQHGWYLLLPLAAALLFALDKLITRRLLAMQESAAALTFYLLAFMSPICLLPCLYFGWQTPTLAQLPWVVLLGLLGVCAHFSFSKAYALAEVTFLMPFGMAKILLCGLISYLAFREAPASANIWIGSITLTASTVLLSLQHYRWPGTRTATPLAQSSKA